MNSETHSTTPPETLIIASRESRLAMWQAEHVQCALHKLYPRCDVKILGMTTRGDQILDRTLSKIGGKGLFVKELEVAFADGRADLAVHSLKDVPMQLPEGFTLSAILEREDPSDAFVSPHYESLAALPEGSIVGTSSLRREAMIRMRFPHLEVRKAHADHRFAAQARRANDASFRQRRERFVVWRHEGIARIFALENRAEREALGQLHRHILERMHGEIGAAIGERDFEFLHEQALAADLRQRAIENLIAARRHSEDFHVATWI